MSLSTPDEKVQKLQAALHAKAKGSPDYHFYTLYDKVYRLGVLTEAYDRGRANRGAPGVDGQGFQDIEAYGRERWLGELAHALKERTYRPQAIRRVYIPKPNGKQRPLGIPAAFRSMNRRSLSTACGFIGGGITPPNAPAGCNRNWNNVALSS